MKPKPTVCPKCNKPPDFRGMHSHHVNPKGMGGRKKAKDYRVNCAIPIPKQDSDETEDQCARCHIDRRHSGRGYDTHIHRAYRA